MSTPNVINYTSTSGTLIHKICSAIMLGLVTGRAVTQSRHVINDVTGPSDHLILQLTVDDLHASLSLPRTLVPVFIQGLVILDFIKDNVLI